jgi:hypothetical protein
MVCARRTGFVLGSSLLFAACGGAPEPHAALTHSWEGGANCGVFRGQAEPLVVEWPAVDRAKLEALAKGGALVAHYADCRLEILSGCQTNATYAWTGVTPKQERETIRTRDELYASLPLGAASLEGALQKSGALEADLTVVGHFQATRATLREDELRGDCAAATHLVRSFSVGAFKFFSGSSESASGGAKVAGTGVGAATSSQRELLTQDGSEVTCVNSVPGGPPPGCGAIVRLELVALDEGNFCPPNTIWSSSAENPRRPGHGWCLPSGVTCPAGTTPSYGSCAALGLTLPPGATCVDKGTCAAECLRGSTDSCVLVFLQGEKLEGGKGTLGFPDYDKACNDGQTLSCFGAGVLLRLGAKTQKSPTLAVRYFDRACSLNMTPACDVLGEMLFNGEGVPEDVAKARALWARACDAGDAMACMKVGGRALDQHNYDRAAELLGRACAGGAPFACTDLGLLHAERGRPGDAFTYYRKGCDAGEPIGCGHLALALAQGNGCAVDPTLAFDLGRRACTNGERVGCYVAGVAYAEGRGTRVNLDRARVSLRLACNPPSAGETLFGEQAAFSDACARLTRM